MSDSTLPTLVMVESNTTGTGRRLCSAARARGLNPVLFTAHEHKYPWAQIDAVDLRIIDTSDADAVAAACAEYQALLGVTSSSELFVYIAANVAHRFGLPGPDAQSVARIRDKFSQRRALEAAGLKVPTYFLVESAQDAAEAASAIGTNVVLKPPDGTGSVGVRRCDDPGEAAKWFVQMPNGIALVEQMIEGPEFSVESVNAQPVAIVKKHLSPAPYFVETGHDFPADISEEDQAEISSVAEKALHALGLTFGMAHTELRLTPIGPVIIEVNPRLAGGMIPVMLHAASGVDLIDTVVALACDLPAWAPEKLKGRGSIRFVMLTESGVVTAVAAADSESESVVCAETTVKVGDLIMRSNSFRDRIGYAIAVGDEAAASATSAAASLSVRVSRRP